jgi:hypothetical protein
LRLQLPTRAEPVLLLVVAPGPVTCDGERAIVSHHSSSSYVCCSSAEPEPEPVGEGEGEGEGGGDESLLAISISLLAPSEFPIRRWHWLRNPQ